MSANLNYHDLWHDLYDFVVERKSLSNQYEFIANIMEEMDPRLGEEAERMEEAKEVVATFLAP